MNSKSYLLILSLLLSLFSLAQVSLENLSIEREDSVNSLIEKSKEVKKIHKRDLLKIGDKLNGYSVQIFSGSKEKALALRKKFNTLHPSVPTKITYSIPNYKVLVGEFLFRKNTSKLRRSIKPSFKNQLVVSSKITVTKANQNNLLKEVIL